MSQSRPTTPGSPREKSVLFCPTCGHESRVDGDWRVRDAPRGTAYDCPNCGATVAVRRRSTLAA